PSLRAFTGAGPGASALAARMQDAWLAFARTGDPNHPGLPPWPAYDGSRRATMLLGARCETVDAPQEAERRVWDGIAGGGGRSRLRGPQPWAHPGRPPPPAPHGP